MKKILLFTVSLFLFTACEKEEIIYEQPPQGGGQELPNPDEDICFEIGPGIIYYRNTGEVDVTGTEVLINKGSIPSHVAIRLYQNGKELQPDGEYWQYEKLSSNNRVWIRPAYIQLMPDQIQGNTLELRLFVFPQGGYEYKFIKEILITLKSG